METKAKYVLVAASVFVLLLLFCLSIIWLTKRGNDQDLRFFQVFFKNQSVSGLQEGSAVTMNGLPVGTVKSAEFDQSNTERVRVLLAVRSSTPVRKDTQAQIDRNLVTGFSTIDLTAGSSSAEKIEGAAKEGTNIPVIPEGATPFAALRSSAPDLLNQSAQILTLLQRLLSPENNAQVTEALTHINEISRALASKEHGLTTTLDNINRFVQEGRVSAASLNQTSETLRHSLQSLSRQVGEATARVATSLHQAAQSVSDAAQVLQNPRRIIRGPASSELGPGEGKNG